MIELRRGYLLFLGDVPLQLDAKTATGIAHWRPEWCVGQRRLPACGADAGLPEMTVEAAREAGAQTLVIGVAPLGGRIMAGPLPRYASGVVFVGLGVSTALADRPR